MNKKKKRQFTKIEEKAMNELSEQMVKVLYKYKVPPRDALSMLQALRLFLVKEKEGVSIDRAEKILQRIDKLEE